MRTKPTTVGASATWLRHHTANAIAQVGLALTLLPIAATAAIIEVGPGAVEAVADHVCSLIEAIENAEADSEVHDDCVAGDGLDTIRLAPGAI